MTSGSFHRNIHFNAKLILLVVHHCSSRERQYDISHGSCHVIHDFSDDYLNLKTDHLAFECTLTLLNPLSCESPQLNPPFLSRPYQHHRNTLLLS